MTTQRRESAGAVAAANPDRVRLTTRILRGVVGVQVLLVFAQAVSAGQWLTGDPTGLQAHQTSGTEIITVVALVQAAVALALWFPVRGPAWPFVVSVALLVVMGMQIGFGFTNRLAVHLPLGLAIFGALLMLLVALRRSSG